MKSWNLIPNIGIESVDCRITFGMSRNRIIEILGSDCSDITTNTLGISCRISLTYDYDDQLDKIEFFDEGARFNDIELFSTTKSAVLKSMANLGYEAQESIIGGEEFPEIGLIIKSDGDAGGMTDKVRYVSMELNFIESGL